MEKPATDIYTLEKLRRGVCTYVDKTVPICLIAVAVVVSAMADVPAVTASWREEVAFPDAAAVERHVAAQEKSNPAVLLAPGELELRAPFSTQRTARCKWRFDFHADLRRATGVAFDFWCDNLRPISTFSIYAIGGKGCYTGAFEPTVTGRWERIVVPKSAFPRNENLVLGWGKIDHLSIAGWRGGTNDVTMRIRNIRALECAPDVAVVRGDWLPRVRADDGYVDTASRMTAALENLGLNVAEMSDLDVDDDALEGVKLVVLPHNTLVPTNALAALRRHVAHGGKLFACYSITKGLEQEIGLRYKGFYAPAKHPENQPIAGILRTGEGLAGQPLRCSRASHCCSLAELAGAGRVLAVWCDAEGRPIPVNCLFKTPSAYFLAHTWRTEDVTGADLLAAILRDVSPAWAGKVDRATDARAARVRADAAWVAAQKSVPGEWRGVSCHNPKGPMGQWSWDTAAKFLKENGFNTLEPNVAYADGIFYRETEEALAACRKYGLESLLWKVTWRPWREPRRELPGRFQVNFKGESPQRWLCPSDPTNLASEVEMYLELARMRPTCISLDYVRYPSADYCFCDGCRAAFERRIGRAVAHWPQDVRRDSALKDEWTSFRCDNITRLVREIARRTRAECPGVKIRIAVFRSPENSPRDVGQDWVAWCREGLLDILAPMDYYDSPEILRRNLLAQKAAVAGTGVIVRPSIGIATLKTMGHDARIVSEQINVIRECGIDGYNIFELNARGIRAFPELRKGVTKAPPAPVAATVPARPRIAVADFGFAPGTNAFGAASDPRVFTRALAPLGETFAVPAGKLADKAVLSRANVDLLVVPAGSAWPYDAVPTLLDYLKRGGALLTTGGYAFDTPAERTPDGNWIPYLPIPQINTRTAHIRDAIHPRPEQINAFDPSFPLRGVDAIGTDATTDPSLPPLTLLGAFSGYAAIAQLGVNGHGYSANRCTWTPILAARAADGADRGPAAAFVHHFEGTFAGSSWAIFGVDNADLFAADSKAVRTLLPAVAKKLLARTALNATTTSYACYRAGENAVLQTRIGNFGKSVRTGTVRFTLRNERGHELACLARPFAAAPGTNTPVEAA